MPFSPSRLPPRAALFTPHCLTFFSFALPFDDAYCCCFAAALAIAAAILRCTLSAEMPCYHATRIRHLPYIYDAIVARCHYDATPLPRCRHYADYAADATPYADVICCASTFTRYATLIIACRCATSLRCRADDFRAAPCAASLLMPLTPPRLPLDTPFRHAFLSLLIATPHCFRQPRLHCNVGNVISAFTTRYAADVAGFACHAHYF